MLEATKGLLLILGAIFPIVDPIGGSPFFLALTNDYGSKARRALSRRIAADSFVLLVGSYFVGTYILAFFGISLPVVEVGGGMILVAMGWATLMENDEGCDKSVRTRIAPQDVFGRAFYPLTLPLTVDRDQFPLPLRWVQTRRAVTLFIL
jgi:multiple antibiotic resistance protein